MNKNIKNLVIGFTAAATILSASPVLAKNEKNENKGRGNSVVSFTKTSDDSSRLKIVDNGIILKVQEVGRRMEIKRLSKHLDLKFKMKLFDDDDMKIRVPRGTSASSSEAFVAAVKQAYTAYVAAIKSARQTFIDAVKKARTDYLTPTTTPANLAPTISVAASANPSTVNGNTTALSVLGADDKGEANLTYTWSIVSKPSGAANPVFSVNGTNAAKNTVATFSTTGSYQFQVTVTDAGLLSATSLVTVNVTVNNGAPTVSSAATANPATVTGSSTALSVLGADDGGENNLTYTWSTVSKPASAANPTFSVNGTNGAKNTTATFTSAGTYQLQATIADLNSLTATSIVTVTVGQTLTAVTLSPATITLPTGSTTQFTAAAFDQFSASQTSTFTWSIFEGILGGTINSSGLYTATTTSGTFHVIGTSNVDTNKKATSTVTVQ